MSVNNNSPLSLKEKKASKRKPKTKSLPPPITLSTIPSTTIPPPLPIPSLLLAPTSTIPPATPPITPLPPSTPTSPPPPPDTIEHIVISGGNVYGFTFYGVLKNLHEKGLWKLSNIKTMYATSIGSIISTIICLNYEWDIIDNFMLNRPLNQLINFDISTVLSCVQNCGFLTIKVIEEYFYNLFTGKDLSPSITMLEFFEFTGIELHFFTTKVLGFELIDLSYKTHPNWTMVEAMYASSAIFPALSPFFKDDQLYIDGGFLLNNPVSMCVSNLISLNIPVSKKVLSIRLKKYVVPSKTRYLTAENYTIFTFFQEFVENILTKLSMGGVNTANNNYIKYFFDLDQDPTKAMDFNIYNNLQARKELIDQGINAVEKWYIELDNGL